MTVAVAVAVVGRGWYLRRHFPALVGTLSSLGGHLLRLERPRPWFRQFQHQTCLQQCIQSSEQQMLYLAR